MTGKDIRDVIKAVKDIRIEDGEKGYETGRCGENVAGIEKWERSYLSRMPGGKKHPLIQRQVLILNARIVTLKSIWNL